MKSVLTPWSQWKRIQCSTIFSFEALQLNRPPAPSRALIQQGYWRALILCWIDASFEDRTMGSFRRPVLCQILKVSNLSKHLETAFSSGRKILARSFSLSSRSEERRVGKECRR